VASYGAQWDEGCRAAARTLGAVARGWADALEETAAASPEEDDPAVRATREEELPAQRARRCLFYMYAIVCHSAGELRKEDVATVLPKPETRNTKPETRNPEPETRNTKPEYRIPNTASLIPNPRT
jgi:hypothetical protein